MTRAAFRQADMERIFRAAKSEGMSVTIDIKTLVVTAIPDIHRQDGVDATANQQPIIQTGNGAPYGKEDWDED
ncbi:hypothetical protein J2855_001803 [Agrobacterium tumefaciens]|uniref:hypothetical protein n=1 Tax=Agrobacterium tumefaciens TaxID=358 RepID=UPI001AE5A418|nr:hypothetical protein [Agrobacterium tumefaciens]MBP2508168.1 hypothetical protein [Agrobacterium tumefaciens]MBP2517320.1 hypothetical protein [Agrobacterium tumefaciens]MBP2575954.1 hypothetical protein [Agrobacterium tumefaciens]MBP2594310.1 hypothetical protein [Agrobacterium tumefaciens]